MPTVPAAPRVVVGVQSCVSGLGALRRAVAESRLRHARLCAVRAWNPGMAFDPAGNLTRADDHGADYATELVAGAFVDAMGSMPDDIDVEISIVAGYPGQVLVGFADRADDLLIVGTCQHRWPRRVIGSPITRFCLRHAACPVLVVPPHELGRQSRRGLRRAVRREAERLAAALPS